MAVDVCIDVRYNSLVRNEILTKLPAAENWVPPKIRFPLKSRQCSISQKHQQISGLEGKSVFSAEIKTSFEKHASYIDIDILNGSYIFDLFQMLKILIFIFYFVMNNFGQTTNDKWGPWEG